MASRIEKGKGKEYNEEVNQELTESKLIVYQLFPRIITNTVESPVRNGKIDQNGCGKFNHLTSTVIRSIKDLGVNTLWLTGVIEHATKTDFTDYGIENDNPNVVKGEAGSPYAIKDYYDVAPALAENIDRRMEEFQNLVERIHKEQLKVIIDFVPNHTARVYHSDKAPEGVEDFGHNDDVTKFFSPRNNYYYIPNQKFTTSFSADDTGSPYNEFPAKATGNDCFSAFCGEYDWYETVKLNYGHDYGDNTDHFDPIPDTWIKMLSILRFWAAKGVDGFRCDMVFMVPLPFWHWAIAEVKKDYPHLIFIGEIYDVGQYRAFLDYGRFDYLYDKVNLYDTLVGIERYNYSAARLTDCWQKIDGMGDRMLNFLENHDEVRFASKEFANDPTKVIPHLVVSSMMSKGPFMIYYGQELGEPATDNEGFAGNNNRTTIFDYWAVDTIRRWYDEGRCSDRLLTQHEKWLRGVYRRVLHLCNALSAVREGNFFDLMYVNLQSPGFDPHSCFSWLRYDSREILLFAVNFASEAKDLAINIPELAFEMAQIPQGEMKAEEVLWNKPITINVSRTEPVRIKVEGNNAVIIKIQKETNI